MFAQIINSLSDLLYTYVLIVLLLGTGIYFTVKTRFVQFRFLREAIRVVMEPKDNEEGLSSFQALMVSTASRVGTGNIAGISTAICIGGPGAVFWMWLTALLGSASAFIEKYTGTDLQEKSPGWHLLWRTGILYSGCIEKTLAGSRVCSISYHDIYGGLQYGGIF